MDLTTLYAPEMPPFLRDAADTPPLIRLRDVGMNCGCEYTAFPRFRSLGRYSRYEHSLGVGLLVWRFTHDEKAAMAGLLHDIATPAFAHVVDFLRGDYLTQESTEAGTRELISSSPELMALLRRYSLTVDEVCDYHIYPIADNDTPRLSADRLEYSLGNMRNFGFRDEAALARMLSSLCVGENEDGEAELMFASLPEALDFALGALACSEIYVSREDRYSMQLLSELLRDALRDGVIGADDLYGTEPKLIGKLCADIVYREKWSDFRAMSALETSPEPQGAGEWRQIYAKKRHIDPLVQGKGRLSSLDKGFADALHGFLSQPQNEWIKKK